MNKILLILSAFLLTIMWTSCDKEEAFDHQFVKFELSDVDSLYFSAGHHMLIADGHAALDMNVEVFRKYQYTNEDGELRDTSLILSLSELPEGTLKVYHVESNTEVGLSYRTVDHTAGTASFYAQIGSVQSEIETVILREKPVLPAKRIIDVIFHSYELSHNDPSYNKFYFQELEHAHIQKAIEDLNNCVNNQLGTSACGASANIEFRLAETNQYGAKMETPGLHRTYYTEESMGDAYPNSWELEDYINAHASQCIWNPDMYLNIQVQQATPNNDLYDLFPQFQIAPIGGESMIAMGSVVNDESEVVAIDPDYFSNYATVCLPVSKNLFFTGKENRIVIAHRIAKFFGIQSTTQSSPTTTDYCTDTRMYFLYKPNADNTGYDGTQSQVYDLVRLGWDGYYFKCDNVTADIRYPSLRNTFTLDQVTRMRYCLDNVPGRRPGYQQ